MNRVTGWTEFSLVAPFCFLFSTRKSKLLERLDSHSTSRNLAGPRNPCRSSASTKLFRCAFWPSATTKESPFCIWFFLCLQMYLFIPCNDWKYIFCWHFYQPQHVLFTRLRKARMVPPNAKWKKRQLLGSKLNFWNWKSREEGGKRAYFQKLGQIKMYFTKD